MINCQVQPEPYHTQTLVHERFNLVKYFLCLEIRKLPVLVLAIGNPTDHSCQCFIQNISSIYYLNI
jgi:hypothetical protein